MRFGVPEPQAVTHLVDGQDLEETIGVLWRPVLHEVGVHLDIAADQFVSVEAPGRPYAVNQESTKSSWEENPMVLIAVVLVCLRNGNAFLLQNDLDAGRRDTRPVDQAPPHDFGPARLGEVHVGWQVVVLEHPEAEREVGLLPVERLFGGWRPGRAGT